MKNAQSPLSWKRLTPELQKQVAATASKEGIRRAALKHNVSETAARNACAVLGIAPVRKYPAPPSLEQRIASARAILRQLKVKPEDLIRSAEKTAW